MKSDPWKRVTSYPNVHEAALAQSALESAGIEAKVFNKHALGAMPHLGQMMQADVMVPHSRVEEARALLQLPTDSSELDLEKALGPDRLKALSSSLLIALSAATVLSLAWLLMKSL